MGQAASSIFKCLLLCGESSEDDEQNQYETPPLLFYSQSPSSPSFPSSTHDNNNNYVFLLRTLSSSSSSSNSFVASTTSHISLPPYTPPDFYNEHTSKCDALDHQNLLGSDTITVWEYRSTSSSGTSSSHGEEELVYFPRFGDEYSSVTATESDPPVDLVIEEEERVSKRGGDISLPPYTPPDFYNDHTIKCDALDHQNLLGSNNITVSKRGVVTKEIRRINHYCSDQRILLVGEGDFSFSRSLGLAFGSASNIIATSLDSIGFLQKNYEKAMSNIQSLKARGCIVLHGVDATQMANHLLLKGMKFDCIIYNFPHAGFRRESRQAQLCRHRALVGGFLENAENMISENGEIHITHKSNGFFREWKLEALALARGLRLVQELHFNLKDYPGYCTKYGFGGDKNFDCSQSKTYKFGLLY